MGGNGAIKNQKRRIGADRHAVLLLFKWNDRRESTAAAAIENAEKKNYYNDPDDIVVVEKVT